MDMANDIFFDFTSENDPIPDFCSDELIDAEILPPIQSNQTNASADSKKISNQTDYSSNAFVIDSKKPNLNLKSLPPSNRFQFTLIHKTNSDFELLKKKHEKFNIKIIPRANKSGDEKAIRVSNSLLFSSHIQSEPDFKEQTNGSSPSNGIIHLF